MVTTNKHSKNRSHLLTRIIPVLISCKFHLEPWSHATHYKWARLRAAQFIESKLGLRYFKPSLAKVLICPHALKCIQTSCQVFNFTLFFFKLELVEIAETPHPLRYLKWENKVAGDCKLWLVTLVTRYGFHSTVYFSIGFHENRDCDFCFFYLDGALPPSTHLYDEKLKKKLWNCEPIPYL